MRAAVYRRFGSADVVSVEEIPTPKPGPEEVLIRVLASTVSAADHRARSHDIPKGLGLLAGVGLGFFQPRRRVLGMDAAGVVEAVGEKITRFTPGDEVIAMLGAKFGGHAEFARIGRDGPITAKPANLGFAESVALVFGGITARAFLNRTDIHPGTRVLVNGASGAVGTAAVQLATDLGAHVTAVCAARNAGLVTALGADRVIDYESSDFTTEPDTYDVIMDCVGNASFDRVQQLITPGGALLAVITDLNGLLRAKSRTRTSGKLVSASGVDCRTEDLRFLVGLAEQGGLRPVIDRSYDLSEIVAAHRFVDAGHKRGSVVLRIAGPA
ncbi:NAD(P)-dependent alcohol dehydrogenase [Cryobacterium adonitolivorans]|uniref:NAD(P)-dependent alcohol dehydrogenase n=1 Tax=Cryobacterium adonitolivorans TaxID=1259189 RepID=A0A4R8W7E0_9MICO|nr:NAD(P)-dependent alcohol dehydrogenase [Cryobacterium adonitolivorans]TFC04112.1 NAD(P)-dependent alcohol dehydrogenase [Cryobacterium adonitolivorans]